MKFAIKGHPKRGNEVIGILEMLGGNNANNCCGKYCDRVYYINENGYIDQDFISHVERNTKFITFSFEEFLEKFPYKVGNKVKAWINGYHSICNIQNMQWDSLINEIEYKIQDYWYSAMDLQPYEEENYCQVIGIGNDTSSNGINTSAYSINEETMEERKYSELRMPLDDDDKLATEITISGNKIVPPDGYLIGKITQVDNGMIVEYVKKQPQYPKTYEECYNILSEFNFTNPEKYDFEFDWRCTIKNKYYGKLMQSFVKLLICRDAYWKIAGDWKEKRKEKTIHHVLYSTPLGEVVKATIPNCIGNYQLDFSTEEMRDIFYENFKELIENCKELL